MLAGSKLLLPYLLRLKMLLCPNVLCLNLWSRYIFFLLESKCLKLSFSFNCVLALLEVVELLLVVFVNEAHINQVVVLAGIGIKADFIVELDDLLYFLILFFCIF